MENNNQKIFEIVEKSKNATKLLEVICEATSKLSEMGIIVKAEVTADSEKWNAYFGL